MQFFGHTLEDGVGIEEKGIPSSGIVELVAHLSLFLLFVRGFLLNCLSVLFLYLLLVLRLLTRFNHLSDILKRRLYVDNPAKDHLIIQLSKCPQSLLLFLVSDEEEAFVVAIVLLGELDFGDVAKPRKGGFYLLLGELVRDVCYVETVGGHLQRLCYEFFVLLAQTRSLYRFHCLL